VQRSPERVVLVYPAHDADHAPDLPDLVQREADDTRVDLVLDGASRAVCET
jgi:hypothetical protein